MSAESPLTFRPGKDRLARLRAYQEREGLTQTGALHRLLDEGMDRAKVKPKPTRKAKVAHNGGDVITAQPEKADRWKL